LERHTKKYLEINPDARIITIFPSKCGFHKRKFPEISKRIIDGFKFSDLRGLKEKIENSL
jgi:hypothetical protein